MVIKNETLPPCQNSETPAAPTSSTPQQDPEEEENVSSREDLLNVDDVDHDHDNGLDAANADDIIDEEEFDQDCDQLDDQETPEDSLSQDTLIQDVVSVSIIEQSSLTVAESSKILVAENNNSISSSSPWVYYYTTAAPAPTDVFILVNTLDLQYISSFNFFEVIKIPCFETYLH